MNPVLNYSLQFIIGGGIIVAMSVLAKYFNPKYAALIYALPLQFTIAAIFIYIGTEQGTIQNLAKNSLFYIFGFVIFIISFYFLTKQFNFWTSLGISYLIFICITVMVTQLT